MMAQTGLTCDDPIHVDNDYVGTVDGPCELWYTADTYDLPLDLRFYPNSDNSTWGPEVQIDFTCVPGVYDDPKLDSLINMVGDFDISFPIELLSELVPGANGKNEFHLSVSKSYREQLADFGITYPVQALVKVTFFEGGSIGIEPDSAFSSCMETADYVNLGDTFDIVANDTERAFVFPFTEWQEDSIRFVWTGAKPAQVYVAVQDCDFTPSEDDPFVWKNFVVAQDAPHKLYSEEMKADIKEHKEGGVYYAKVIAPGTGKLVVEKIPMSAISGGAQLLEHGDEVVLEDVLYCFPKTWTATQILVATTQPVTMYVSNMVDFTASVEDSKVLATCVANLEDNHRAVYLSKKELTNLANQAVDDFLYVRFSCAASTKISINSWDASECANQSFVLTPNVPAFIAANSSATIYRARYADYSGYPLTIKWDSSDKVTAYIAETCDFYLTSTNEVLLVNPSPIIAKGGELHIEAADIDLWASRIDEEGYFYVRLDSKRAGEITFATEKTEETPITPDPIYTNDSAAICFGDTYEWNGQTYSETGKYTYTTVATNGADSIVTLDLTVYPQTEATTEKVEIPFGETYEWNGVVYNESGEYTITLQDENGCDYQATLILTVLPEEKPENPCVLASTLLEPVAELTLNLGNAFDIYRIDYEAWLASGVNLVWTGKGALHTFVAKDCEFAVAIYHKDVVNYTEVPAEGNVVLSKDILAPLAQYIDADGYLYVRFLTELEGQLSTTLAE